MNIAEETLRKYRIRLIEQEKSTHTIKKIYARYPVLHRFSG